MLIIGESTMNVKDFYDQIDGDYDDVLERFGDESLVKRFALKFLGDDSFNGLEQKINSCDVQEKFRAAHTLKGVCANLGFSQLFNYSSELTELFRAGRTDGETELFEKLRNQYALTVDSLKNLQLD